MVGSSLAVAAKEGSGNCDVVVVNLIVLVLLASVLVLVSEH